MAELPSHKYVIEDEIPPGNDSHAFLVELVGPGQRVLEAGCADGYTTRRLAANGCTVTGVELDPELAKAAEQWCDRVVVGDIDQLDLAEAFPEGGFDAIVFGDVLEHLRDPSRTLRQARRLLAPKGSIVVSVPNVAHGSVRLALLQGRFEYRPLGLLDETHIRFFTRDSLDRLVAEAGLAIVELRRTTADPFGTEIPLDPAAFPAEVTAMVAADPESSTYQFVFRAIPDDADGAVAALRRREEHQRAEIDGLRRQLAEARAAQEAAEAELGGLRATKLLRWSAGARRLYSRLRK